jgi:16S rRNA (uracil1498-N3)-methyltransferase
VTAPRIYTENNPGLGAELALEAGPSRHLAGALRLGVGAAVTLFDGNGGEYGAVITGVERKQVSVRIDSHQLKERESPLRIHLGISISRGERMDWIVQKATELGVTEISPLLSERTEVKLKGERAEKKIQHWRQVAISACEQCGRNRLPGIHPLQRIDAWSAGVQASCKLVLHHRSACTLGELETPTELALLVGPEGGLSSTEITAAEQLGFRPLALGPRILRTETAPLAALAILQSHWGDMS